MPSTPFDVIVFDFDGTLVCSAEAKRQAFFDVFPPCCAAAVEAILARDADGSRHKVIPEMIAEALRRGLAADGLQAKSLIEAYGDRARAAVAAAETMPGAPDVLAWAGTSAATYVVSMTPHGDLQGLLEARGWLGLLRGAFGFPHKKADVVAMLLARHGIAASRLLVVGDGVSDREAARQNGCAFHLIDSIHSLRQIPGLGEVSHA